MPSQRDSASKQRSTSTRGSTSLGWQANLSHRPASTQLSRTNQTSSSSQPPSSTSRSSSNRQSATRQSSSNQALSTTNTQQQTADASGSQNDSLSDDNGDSRSTTSSEDEATDDQVTYQLVSYSPAMDELVEIYHASEPDPTGETTQSLQVVGSISDRASGRSSRMRFRTNVEFRAYLRAETKRPSLVPWVRNREEMPDRIARRS